MPTPPRPDPTGLPPHYVLRDEWELTPRDLQTRLAASEPIILLDVRTPQELAVARITPPPTAETYHVPLHELIACLPELEDLAHRPVVTLCHHGMRSLQAAVLLRQAGFTNVRSLAGGIDAWSLAIDPTVPRY